MNNLVSAAAYCSFSKAEILISCILPCMTKQGQLPSNNRLFVDNFRSISSSRNDDDQTSSRGKKVMIIVCCNYMQMNVLVEEDQERDDGAPN